MSTYHREEAILNASRMIWEYAELKFDTPKSIELYFEILEAEGFRIEKGIGGLDCAFKASYGGAGTQIALLAEYDALADMSQRAFSSSKIALVENGSGHACGHNLLGLGCLSAALEVKDALDAGLCSGGIHLFGCPAEESGYGKSLMVKAGVFAGMDLALSWHPHEKTQVWTAQSLAVEQVYYHFEGIASHAALSPELGRSALDACELMNVGVNYLREHVLSSVRLHYSYHDSGSPSANVVSAKASLHYFIRAHDKKVLASVCERVTNVAKGAALMTGTKLSVKRDASCESFVANTVLSEVLDRYARSIVPSAFDETHRSFVRDVFKTEINESVEPFEFGGFESLSTDVGDVSQCLPCAQIYVCCEPKGTTMHSWQWVSNGISDFAHRGMFAASQVLAQSSIELLNNHELVMRAYKEWAKD